VVLEQILAYINDIWINLDSTIRLFADDCIIYREVKNNNDMENLQTDLNRLGKWAVENAMKINLTESKVVCFMRAQVKKPLNCMLVGMVIPEASSCKYLGIILHSDLSWSDQVNYTVEKSLEGTSFYNAYSEKGK
jgi:hypothetical protein